jgi:hypothetical protein
MTDRPRGPVGKMLHDVQTDLHDVQTELHDELHDVQTEPHCPIRWGDLTDTELLTMLAEHFELIRRLAMIEGPLRANGVRIPKLRAIALECKMARERILSHLAGET